MEIAILGSVSRTRRPNGKTKNGRPMKRDAWLGGLVMLMSIFYIGARPRWAAAITNLTR